MCFDVLCFGVLWYAMFCTRCAVLKTLLKDKCASMFRKVGDSMCYDMLCVRCWGVVSWGELCYMPLLKDKYISKRIMMGGSTRYAGLYIGVLCWGELCCATRQQAQQAGRQRVLRRAVRWCDLLG